MTLWVGRFSPIRLPDPGGMPSNEVKDADLQARGSGHILASWFVLSCEEVGSQTCKKGWQVGNFKSPIGIKTLTFIFRVPL